MLNKIIADLFAEKPKTVLFHYTSYSGLSGIADSKTLRLSEVRHLNDAQEISNLKRWLHEAIYERFKEFTGGKIDLIGGDNELVENFLNLRTFETWMEFQLGKGALALFVGSFTEAGNLLSQWRGYCPFGKGVSVGFEPAELSKCAKRSSILLGQCIYDAESKKELAGKILDGVTDFCKRKGPVPIGEDPFSNPHYFSEIEPCLLTIASLVKHEDFREEVEWRIVLSALEIDEAPIAGYREGKTAFIPYVEFDLPVANNGKLSLDQIFLGPTSDEDLAYRSLKLFVRDKTACRKVSRTRSPYREM